MFELRTVTKTFPSADGACTILDNFSCTFKPAVSYAVMGSSGVGKSTLLHLLAGLEQPTTGDIFFENMNVGLMSARDETKYSTFLQQHIGLVFQKPCLIPELTVLENVQLKGLIAHMPKEDLYERAREVLRLVGLHNMEHRNVVTLSGGQQQRLSLARALVITPQFLLLDEPTAHVDKATAQDIITLLRAVQAEHGVGIVMVTHDTQAAQAMDIVMVMENGRLHEK